MYEKLVCKHFDNSTTVPNQLCVEVYTAGVIHTHTHECCMFQKQGTSRVPDFVRKRQEETSNADGIAVTAFNVSVQTLGLDKVYLLMVSLLTGIDCQCQTAHLSSLALATIVEC